MAASTVIVLGGGWGGVTAAAQLRLRLEAQHRVVLVEQRASFALCMANLWIMSGERQDPRDGDVALGALAGRGIEFVQARIESIDPTARAVRTSAGDLHGDVLVVALGAQRNGAALPGFADAALDVYDREGALRVRDALAAFAGGRVLLLVARTPFSCPSAPYEAAFAVEETLRIRGLRARSEVAVYTPEDLPMAVAGRHIGAALVEMLDRRGIAFHPEHIAMKVDAPRKRVLFELDDAPFDLLLGVPPHIAPAVARDAGMTDASGWIPVDASTLETRFPGVYAIGDITAVRLANGMFLPKAGVFADAEARVVAANIAAAINGASATQAYDGRGLCYIETGGREAAYGAGAFYALPAPRVTLEEPQPRFWREKRELERAVLAQAGA